MNLSFQHDPYQRPETCCRESLAKAGRLRNPDEELRRSKVDVRFGAVAGYVTWLASRTFTGTATQTDFDELDMLLATLSLAADEYGLVMLRLNYAMNNYVAREPGTAAFELKLIAGRLNSNRKEANPRFARVS